MNDLGSMRELFAYTSWADAVVWKAVLGNTSASADARLRDYLYHIQMVQEVFLKIWRGEQLKDVGRETSDLATVFGLARSTHEGLTRFLSELGERSLSERAVLPWAGRVTELTGKEPAQTTLGETMMQVVNHSTYHRGQVNARLREVGGAPPMTDYIAWVLVGKPASAWLAEDGQDGAR